MSNIWDQSSKVQANGVFWTPDLPDRHIHGILSFAADEGVVLELFGGFQEFGGERYNCRLIHGIANGRAVTLYKAFYKGTNVHLRHGKTTTSQFIAIYLFDGAILDPEQATFSFSKVQFTGLEEWFGHIPFVQVDAASSDYDALMGYVSPALPSTSVPTLSAQIGFTYHASLGGPDFKEVRWRNTMSLKVTPEIPRIAFEFYWETMRRLQNLLTLLIGEPVFATSVHFRINDDEVGLLFQDKIRPNKFSALQMLTLFPQIQSEWSAILNRWFEKAEVLNRTTTLLFGAMVTPVNVEMQFLRLAQAIESYHRNVRGGQYMPEADYRAEVYNILLAEIPPGISPSLKQSLKAKLRFGNEFSFRKRLHDLLSTLPNDVLRLVKLKDQDKFVEAIVNNRNALTHHTQELNEFKSSPTELWELSMSLQAILVFLLFVEIGLSGEVMAKRLSNRYDFLFNQPK